MKNTTKQKKTHSHTKQTASRVQPMNADEFHELVGPTPPAVLAEYFEVDQRTVRRWLSGQTDIPGAVARLARMRYTDDASALLGKEWAGYRFGKDGKLYIDVWRGGFDPHQIRGMFFKVQLVNHHEATIRQMEKRIAQLEQDVIDAHEAAVKYRNLVSREAKFGLMLERIAG